MQTDKSQIGLRLVPLQARGTSQRSHVTVAVTGSFRNRSGDGLVGVVRLNVAFLGKIHPEVPQKMSLFKNSFKKSPIFTENFTVK